MPELHIPFGDSFRAIVREQPFDVEGISELPEKSLVKIFEYGLQRILNDASAGAKSKSEALDKAQARWDNLVIGVIRAGGGGKTGDPVMRRAIEIAEAKVKVNADFKKWLADNDLKIGDKEAQQELRAQAKQHASKFIDLAQSQIDEESGIELKISL